MSTWSGWIKDFLGAHDVPDTPDNETFLASWANHANHPGCGNNPIDLTDANTASKDCASTGFVGRHVQAYTSHAYARTAYFAQLTSGDYPHLYAALKSGNPYSVTDWQKVADDLGNWTSGKFANVYLSEMAGGSGPDVTATHALGGWADLRRSVNHRMPTSLRHARDVNKAALRTVAKARKVRL